MAAAAAAAAAHGTRRGFSVQVPVPVERQGPGPVLVPCPQGDGGVQVLRLLLPYELMPTILVVLQNQWDLLRGKNTYFGRLRDDLTVVGIRMAP